MASSLTNKLQQYVSVVRKLTKPKGFGNALGLQIEKLDFLADTSRDHITDPDRTVVQLNPPKENGHTSDMIVTYIIPSKSCINGSFPLSGFLAVFDEVTTLATVVKGLERKKGVLSDAVKPGVSVTLSAEIGPGWMNHRCIPGDKVDIHVSTIKMGSIFAFTKATAVTSEDGHVICTGRHCKYLPMRSWPAWLVLGPLFDLASWYCTDSKAKGNESSQSSSRENSKTMDDILQMKEGGKDGTEATFQVQDHHCNPFGSLHGGCTAMISEKMGNNFLLRSHTDSSMMELSAMSITYMTEGRGEVSLEAEELVSNDQGSKLRVVSKRVKGGSTIAECILTYDAIPDCQEQTRSKL